MTKMEKEILEQPKVLASLKGVNEVTIKNLVSDIKQRDIRMVYFAARGTSDHASIYASYLISTYVGVPTALALPSVITAYDGKLCLKDALVIGVSQSGKAADVLAVMEKAKQCGALTIAVTNDLQSPMAQFGDYHLYCNAGLEESVAATKTFTSQMYVLAMLAAVWGDNAAMLAKLDEVPGAVEQLLSYIPHDIEKIIQRVPLFIFFFTAAVRFYPGGIIQKGTDLQQFCDPQGTSDLQAFQGTADIFGTAEVDVSFLKQTGQGILSLFLLIFNLSW